ncbi:MAG: DUF2961 domain-containing protein [Lentisphaerae bacterium]|nr:DUF2961 domain-containing protein [Lentisphaerota bacterium]
MKASRYPYALQIVFLPLLLLCSCRQSPPIPTVPITLESLVHRIADVDTFAERPLGNSFLLSSYDPSGGNMDWSVWKQTNPSGRITLLDVDGPGYISRIWIASFYAERWLFFFDGETTPRLDLTHAQMFGGTFPFRPPLAGHSGGGSYCTVPIPFAKHLRIEIVPSRLQPNDRNYYHINYTLAATGHPADSWPITLSPAQSNAVVLANETLDADRDAMSALATALPQNSQIRSLSPGAHTDILNHSGSGTVKGLTIRITDPDPSGQLKHELLRNIRIKAWWDGSKTPSMDTPLGDFFCNPFYTREFSALALARLDDTFVCRFPMPFKKNARITLENHSTVPVQFQVGTDVLERPKQQATRYFHANWAASSTSGQPLTMLNATGAGHYIGCFLTAIGQDGSWTILEGDEYVLPDEGRQPGQYGTGLEDYFNGAYYYTSLFDLPYHGLIEKGAMRTDQYRFHGLDAVDFEDSLTIGIEFGDRNHAQGYMSSVAYWYADAPQDCSLPPAQEPLLARPPDRFELPGLMSMLFTLEREGLWADAATRCDFFAARYARYPWADLLRLRAAAYREKTSGIEAVRALYEALTQSPHPAAAQQAKDLLWLHEKETNALLGYHMRGKYKLWLDGVEIATGNSKAKLDVRRLSIQPGRHTWEVDFEPNIQGSLLSLCLRTKWGDVVSSGPWETIDIEKMVGAEPPETFLGRYSLPNMTVWQFEPNAYVGMQSGVQVVQLWFFSHPRPYAKRIRLKQSWDLKQASAATAPTEAPERSEEELKAHAIN